MAERFDPMKHLSQARKNGPANYLGVAWRLAWLRDKYPDATLTTEALQVTDGFAFFKATVTAEVERRGDDDVTRGQATATGHGSETKADFRDYIEKAETKAIGRALAAFGLGTQFAIMDFGEGDSFADAPIQQQQRAPQPYQRQAEAQQPVIATSSDDWFTQIEAATDQPSLVKIANAMAKERVSSSHPAKQRMKERMAEFSSAIGQGA